MSGFRDGTKIKHVGVIGAGLIGGGWAAAFLAQGLTVSVYDPSSDARAKLRTHINAVWPSLEARGLSPHANKSALACHATLGAALTGVDFVQENAPEREDLKTALFEQFGVLVPPDVIIASSTSSMLVTELQKSCRHPERCVLGHPFNPVHLMPLVEVGGGTATDQAAIDTAMAFYAGLGKKPILLKKEIFGHIANRLTSAMFREAVSLVANGVASVRDVDDAIRFGPALKWAIQGEFTTFHTSGGKDGLAGFLKHFSPGVIKRWQSMQDPDLADPELQTALVQQMQEATGNAPVSRIARRQDDLLLELLKILG